MASDNPFPRRGNLLGDALAFVSEERARESVYSLVTVEVEGRPHRCPVEVRWVENDLRVASIFLKGRRVQDDPKGCLY